MSRHLAPATYIRTLREDYARRFPRAGLFFDADRRAMGKGRHVKAEL